MQRTQVTIIGVGPSGLLLSQLLSRHGIDSVVLEQRSREYVEARIRAGLLEQSTVDLLSAAGVGQRLHTEGLVHEGIELAFDNRMLRIDLKSLCGSAMTVYGQTEITKDLGDARAASDGKVFYEAADVSLAEFDGRKPKVSFTHRGTAMTLNCDFIAGCDGSHGVSRRSVSHTAIRTHERVYPFGWLGVLSEAPAGGR